jgi:hypothetical protein
MGSRGKSWHPSEKEESTLEEVSGYSSNCEPTPGPKYAEASIISNYFGFLFG